MFRFFERELEPDEDDDDGYEDNIFQDFGSLRATCLMRATRGSADLLQGQEVTSRSRPHALRAVERHLQVLKVSYHPAGKMAYPVWSFLCI